MSKRPWRVCACMALVALALSGCAPKTGGLPPVPAENQAVSAVPKVAEGISFVVEGQLMVIRGSKAEKVAAAGQVQAVGTGADAGGLVVRDSAPATSAQVSWFQPGSGKFTELWRSEEAGSLGAVRCMGKPDAVWFSVFGDPKTVLKSATPPGSEAMIRALDSSFNGEFDVDALGDAIVYVSETQNPSVLTLRDSEGESAVPTELALIFSPDLAADGESLCFIGGQSATDLSVWVFDRGQGELSELAQTRGLGPTVPVFSADGVNVAFRSAEDGALWVVDVAGGKPQKLPFTADEGPIGW